MSHQHAAGGNETITTVEEPGEENFNLIPATSSLEKDISEKHERMSQNALSYHQPVTYYQSY